MNNVLKHKIETQKLLETTVSGIGQSSYTNFSLPNYFGARYLDPRTSRWLSVDPALGEYIPSPGQGADRLPGLGGIYNYVNMHVYHYSGNNPIRYKDPDGRFTEEEIQQALATIIAASPNATYHPYSTLINTGMLTYILKNNYTDLDLDSRFYVNRTPSSDLQNQLNNITVIMDVNGSVALTVLDQLGFSVGTNPQAISVGNTILVFYRMEQDNNGRIKFQDDADLLGHEAIHLLQILSVGGLANAAIIYQRRAMLTQREGRHPYYGHPWEVGPYSFGPQNSTAADNGALPNTIFSRYWGWHK